MNLTPEQYRAVQRSTLKLLHRVLRGQEASMLRVEGEDGEVRMIVMAARGDTARAVVGAFMTVMGNPKATEQWEVPG